MRAKKSICYFNENVADNIDYDKPININFTKDYDINHLNFIILNKFKNYTKKIKKIDKEIKKIEQKLEQKISKLKYTYYKNEIKILNEEKREILEEKEKKKYINCTKELLQYYNNSSQENKYQIIHDYLNVASKYINLIIYKKEESSNYCHSCGYEIIYLDNVDSIQVCLNCGVQLQNTLISKSYIRMSSGEENKPINTGNFNKIINAFKCNDGFILNKNISLLLDEYYISNDIKDLKKIKSGKCKHNSISMMRRALNKIGKPDYYKNIYSICHQYFGFEQNNISDIEISLMILYEKVQIWFKNNPSKQRDSSLNNQWILYKLCEYLAPGRFEKDDFMIISSEKSLIFHHDRWQEMLNSTNIFS